MNFDQLVELCRETHAEVQHRAARTVDLFLIARNWLFGCSIVEFEQNGKDRATYGERLLPELAQRLANAGLTRVDARELRRFRLLYTVYPQIRETVSPELLAQSGIAPLMMFLQSDSSGESATPKSKVVEALTSQLIPSELGLISRLDLHTNHGQP